MQQIFGGRCQGPAASDDVRFSRVLSDIVTDPTDTRNEQHAGREALGEDLGIMAGTAGHADPTARGVDLSGRSQTLLNGFVHDGGLLPGKHGFQIDLDRPVVMGFFHDLHGFRFQAIEDF